MKSTIFVSLCASLALIALPALADDDANSASNSSARTENQMGGQTAQTQQTTPSGSQDAATTKSTTTTTTTQSKSGDMALSQQDYMKAKDLNTLHHINQKEIQLSKLAQDKAQAKEVKDFAQHMITDHEAADKKVEEAAKTANMKLEDFAPATYEKVVMDQLGKYSGAQFDNMFVAEMKAGHRHAMHDLQMIRNMDQDSSVRSLVDAVIPKVRDHEKMASNLKVQTMKQMAGSSSSDASSMDNSSSDNSSSSDSSMKQ